MVWCITGICVDLNGSRRCAYCAIPIITGKHVSRPIDEILDEVRQLVADGVKEFQIIAQELTYYKRGRNAHVHQIPKNATREQYAKATGLECLFGALYLAGRVERLNELFFATMEEPHAL